MMSVTRGGLSPSPGAMPGYLHSPRGAAGMNQSQETPEKSRSRGRGTATVLGAEQLGRQRAELPMPRAEVIQKA